MFYRLFLKNSIERFFGSGPGLAFRSFAFKDAVFCVCVIEPTKSVRELHWKSSYPLLPFLDFLFYQGNHLKLIKDSPLDAEPTKTLEKAEQTLLFPNAVVLNAVGRRNTQMSAKERKRKSAKEHKRAQKGAKERKKALLRKNANNQV